VLHDADETSGRQHGAISSDSGYALSLSHTHALVWPYAVNHSSPETFVFALPHPSKSPADPLPLGSLVSSSAGLSEPGLVVINPRLGRITYWESVTSAATLDLIQQQRHGVEFTIPGMMSGETVLQVLNAESAGFILGFSSGRLAYMRVRDGQGRPAVNVLFLRSNSVNSGSGFFGSLRNVLGTAASKGDFAAARAGVSTKPGERMVVVLTTKGRLQAWDIHRGGHHSLSAEADARTIILQSLEATYDHLAYDDITTSLETIDVAFTKSSNLPSSTNAEEFAEITVMFLCSLAKADKQIYFLVQASLSATRLEVTDTRQLTSFTGSLNRSATSSPRLYLPEPGTVAFVVFDRAVIVASLIVPKSPNQGERWSNGEPQAMFEDVVDFTKDSNIEIVGSGSESAVGQQHMDEGKPRRHKSKHPAVLLLLRGGGLVRVAVTGLQKLGSDSPQNMTAKSRLEQAVFFGTMANNPLNFNGRREEEFSDEEIAKAALELASDIITSQTPYIPALPASVDQNLQRKSSAMKALASHLRAIDAKLDRISKWNLLWTAEKLKAAEAAWARYEAQLQYRAAGNKRGLFNDIVLCIHERFKTEPLEEAGELDRVRHWFVHDVYRLEIALPWAYQVIRNMFQSGETAVVSLLDMTREANDFVGAVLSTAYKFREENLGLYGLADEKVENGVLTSEYEDLPEIWTATKYVVENTAKQVSLTTSLLEDHWQVKEPKLPEGEQAPDQKLLGLVRTKCPDMVDVSIGCDTERQRFLAVGRSRSQHEGSEHKSAKAGREQLESLARLGLVDEAIAVAEKHKMYLSMASLTIEEMERVSWEKERLRGEEGAPMAYRRYCVKEEQYSQAIQDYINKYGADFANKLYKYYLGREELYDLITDETGKAKYLTDFLRSNKQLAKLAWIQEVVSMRDYDRAADNLLSLGLHNKEDLWSQKVELSMGKLARIAARSCDARGGDKAEPDFSSTNRTLSLVQIQEKAYAHIYPVLKMAIDDKAELQLAVETFGAKTPTNLPTSRAMLTSMLKMLVQHVPMDCGQLVDLLTLMTLDAHADGPLQGLQFHYALKALEAAPPAFPDRELMERVTWRRCMLRDNWTEINNTKLKDDGEVQERLRSTALYSTLRERLGMGKERGRARQTGLTHFFADSSGGPGIVKACSPSDVQAAGCDDPGQRFGKADQALHGKAVKEMVAESQKLRAHMAKSQLEKWFASAVDLAREDLRRERPAEAGDDGGVQRARTELAQIEARIAQRTFEAGQAMLRARPMRTVS
jgi:nuclear pore complex protein Nup133